MTPTEPNNLTRLNDATEIIGAAAQCLCDEGETVEDVLDRVFLLQLRTVIVDELKARDERNATVRTEAAVAMRESAQQAVEDCTYSWHSSEVKRFKDSIKEAIAALTIEGE